MGEGESKSGGVLAPLRRMGDSLLALFYTRLELASLELQEERIRLVGFLLRVIALFILANLALVAITGLVVVIFWEKSRVPALIGLSVIYALAALALWWDLR
jgi:uncharacterized membrane protein YqjE